MDESQSSLRKTIKLTEALKTDSDLCLVRERLTKSIRESQRVCRCTQLKLLKEKTIEKTRLSQEALRQSIPIHPKRESRRLTKQEINTGLVENGSLRSESVKIKELETKVNLNGSEIIESSRTKLSKIENLASLQPCHTALSQTVKSASIQPSKVDLMQSDSLAGYVDDAATDEILKESAEFTALPSVKSSNLEVPKMSSIEKRYSNLFDNDITGSLSILKEENVATESQQRLSLMLEQGRKSSKEERYQQHPVKVEVKEKNIPRKSKLIGSESYKRLTILHDQLVAEPIKTLPEKQCNEIFDNDAFGCTEAKQSNKHHGIEPGRSVEPDLKSLEPDVQMEDSSLKIGNADIKIGASCVQIAESCQRIDSSCQQNEVLCSSKPENWSHKIIKLPKTINHLAQPSINPEESKNNLSRKNSETSTTSCTSHLKPHKYSQQNSSCFSSCVISSDEATKTDLQYDADDEVSKATTRGSIKGNCDKSVKCSSIICQNKRVCTCAMKFPELFEKFNGSN